MSRPLMVAYGMGVDSTAMLVGLHARGIRPDAILFADTVAKTVEVEDVQTIFDAVRKESGLFEPNLR